MSQLLGICGLGQQPDASERFLASIARSPRTATANLYRDDCFRIAHAQHRVTPQDRLERQPSTHASGRFVLAIDGWLANRAELGTALGFEAPETHPDSAIIAAALMRWGDDALPRFHGDLALTWWDSVDRRLLLACDRTGGRALFYHCGQQLLFATTLPALFAHPRAPRVLDADQVARAAFVATLDLERTCFRGIHQLVPGQKLVWTPDRGARLSHYGGLDLHHRIRFRRDEDYVDAARELLDRVVGEALRIDGPLVSMLSGGLDSSAVAATAARIAAPGQLHTLTVRPDAASARPTATSRTFDDEWASAQAVAAAHPNIVAHEARARWALAESAIRRDMAFTGRPPMHLMAGTWFDALHCQVRELGGRAVLGGFSGNATLSASGLRPPMQPGLTDFPAAVGEIIAMQTSDRAGMAGRLLKSMTPSWLRAARRGLTGHAAPWAAGLPLRVEAAERIGMDAIWDRYLAGDRRAGWHNRARLRQLERSWTARSTGAPLSARRAEIRDPLGDFRLAQFCLAIPSNQFARRGHDRFLARRVLADRLPAQIVQECRLGRQNAEWFDWLTRNRPWLASELDAIDASPLGRELLDIPRLRTALEDWPADAGAAEHRIEALMAVLGRGVALGNFIRWAEGTNE